MKISLPTLEKLEINQSTALLDESRLGGVTHALLVLPKPVAARIADDLPCADAINARLRRGGWKKIPPHLVLDLGNKRGTRLVVGFVDAGADAFHRQTAARKLIAVALQEPIQELALACAGMADELSGWMDALVAAAGAAAFELAHFKRDATPTVALRRLKLLGLHRRLDLSNTQAATLGNNLARWLSALPGNALTPKSYRRVLAQLAKRYGWEMETLDRKALTKQKCGAFLAVVQASEDQDAAIIRLRYRTKAKSQGKVALVGKGICYDTGGVNLKPARYMYGMHEDMLGSAVALGSLLALTELRAPMAVECWLALAENHIGPRAYKPNDVITACDGTTIEIVHSDAEGRMVLADTLTLVARTKPDLAMDFATLTGACVAALSTRYSGVFSNRPKFNELLIRAGQDSGERVWPFPQDTDYDEMIESKVADIKQCSMENEADHILGARFLSRFIGKDTPWVHVDLAAGGSKGGLGAIPTESTGFGVRFTLEALLGPNALPLSRGD